jgi:aspartokinase/homoserine dehydrogenase 1
MNVLKFGGTSLESPQRIATVVEIVRDKQTESEVAVVVSAMAGVTDALNEAARVAARGLTDYREALENLAKRHLEAIAKLAKPNERASLEERVERRLGELGNLLHGVSLLRECTPRILDQVSSYGERLSADIVAAALRAAGTRAEYADARQFIVTDKNFGAARVIADATETKTRDYFGIHEPLQVVTGFLGATPSGETTTLGRGGSDYTAALLGSALEAERIEIWTDVNGVMSADPRLVKNAFSLPELSYEELMELSHFGAKVVYPPTIHPARARNIPIIIKNTFEPAFEGTRIAGKAAPSQRPVRGISSINNIALARLEGDGMLGVPGTARRLFEALARSEINVILITQASSEHSICFAVAPEDVNEARQQVSAEFTLERGAGLIDELVVERELSIVAAVGEEMRERPGIAGRLFNVLGSAGINVRAIAQGSSELNISLVVARADERAALNAIHDALLGEHRRTAYVVVAGLGGVGGALLTQLATQASSLRSSHGLDLRLAGVATSRQMKLDRLGLDPARGRALLADAAPSDLDALATFVESLPGLRVFVDATASTEVASLYGRLLAHDIAIVTANKIPLAGPMTAFETLRRSGRVYYETTAGAGLPVVRTVKNLVDTGDHVERIEGVFSGTLSYLFDQLRRGVAFDAALEDAREKGYTEPDPREDLSGADVARKLLIVTRTAGIELELDDIDVESLVGLTETIEKKHREASAEGRVLCYLARFDGRSARVGLESVEASHPAAALEGTDNLFAVTTSRYRSSPLVVRGSGAGPAVTAAGVFADILQACAESR